MAIPVEKRSNLGAVSFTAKTRDEMKANILEYVNLRGDLGLLGSADMNRMFSIGAKKFGVSVSALLSELEGEGLLFMIDSGKGARLVCSESYYTFLEEENALPDNKDDNFRLAVANYYRNR